MKSEVTVRPSVGVSLLHWVLTIQMFFFVFVGGVFFLFALAEMVEFTQALVRDNQSAGSFFALTIFGGGLLFVVGSLLFQILNLKATVYKISSDGIHFHEGFFTRHEKFLPTKRITDVRLIQKWPWDTWFGTGSVVVETAGFGSTLILATIPSPRKYYDIIKELTLKGK